MIEWFALYAYLLNKGLCVDTNSSPVINLVHSIAVPSCAIRIILLTSLLK